MDKTRGLCRGVVVLAALTWLLSVGGGCTRLFYRKQVDKAVDEVLRDKDVFPGWKIQNMDFYPDPRARFGDPTNPDRPPMPPDDPAAKRLGPNPQKPGHAGSGRVEATGYLDLLSTWDAENRSERAGQGRGNAVNSDIPSGLRVAAFWQDRPKELDWTKANPLEPAAPVQTPYLLRIDQAMELGLINSREFQTRREDLYLTALPVTRERFSFAAQYFAIGQAYRENSSPFFTGSNESGSKASSAAGVSKLFSTGALLLLGFANQTVLDLTNPPGRSLTSVSTLNLDFIQPLLRGGGRAVTLEPLTLAERNLLYDIRNYARFRKEYYQYLIGGGSLSITPGSVQGAGSLASSHPLFSTLSGANIARQQVVPNGLGAVGGAAAPGTLFLGINPIAQSVGFLPTLYKDIIIRYEEANVKALLSLEPLMKGYAEGGLVSSLQVEQVKLQRLQGESSLLAKVQDGANSIDTFKAQLGLPINVLLKLDDEPAWPIIDQLRRYDRILEDYKVTIKQVDGLYKDIKADGIRNDVERLARDSQLTKPAVQFHKSLDSAWERWRKKDDKALETDIKKQERELDRLRTLHREMANQGKKLTRKDEDELREAGFEYATARLEKAVRIFARAPWLQRKEGPAQVIERSARWGDVRNTFRDVLVEAKNERYSSLRPQWKGLTPVVVEGVDLLAGSQESAYEVVTRTALDNRLDLMNTRAQVVDGWRQIRVFANGLLGAFNLAYHMDSSTPPGAATPLAFSNAQTRHQLIMNFELPIVRITERNAYRASLIAYQRSRRDLQQKEDEIVAAVRAEIRQLQVLVQNLKIQQDAIELAYRQVDSAYEIFTAPQVPDNSPNAAANTASNAAALTNQLLQAYGRLPQAQEQVLKTWIDYQIARQQLYLDLELMPVDARGVWIDEFSNNPSGRQPASQQPQQRQRDVPLRARQGA